MNWRTGQSRCNRITRMKRIMFLRGTEEQGHKGTEEQRIIGILIVILIVIERHDEVTMFSDTSTSEA